jgi:hypothetical protein
LSKKKKKIACDIGSFLQQYERKKEQGYDPNDRGYDRELEEQIKKMSPEELSEIMTGYGSDISQEIDELWFSSKPVPGVLFSLNDHVKIIKGKYSGLKGIVVFLLTLSPEPRFLVEISSGEQIIGINQSQLDALSKNSDNS